MSCLGYALGWRLHTEGALHVADHPSRPSVLKSPKAWKEVDFVSKSCCWSSSEPQSSRKSNRKEVRLQQTKTSRSGEGNSPSYTVEPKIYIFSRCETLWLFEAKWNYYRTALKTHHFIHFLRVFQSSNSSFNSHWWVTYSPYYMHYILFLIVFTVSMFEVNFWVFDCLWVLRWLCVIVLTRYDGLTTSTNGTLPSHSQLGSAMSQSIISVMFNLDYKYT